MRFAKYLSKYLLCLLLLPLTARSATDALIKLPNFDGLAAKASESVNITLDEQLLKVAARFLSSGQPQDAQARKLLEGLRGIYVKSYTFPESFVFPKADIEAIRKQLVAPSWNQLVAVRSSKEQEDVGIYVSLNDSNQANGLVIISVGVHEFTIVNIVGAIDLDQLKNIEGKFGIPKLELEAKKGSKK